MSSSKYLPLPGPWEVFTNDEGEVGIQRVGARKGEVILWLPGDMETIEGQELANVQLAAASPDLLAACKEALCCLTGYERSQWRKAVAEQIAYPEQPYHDIAAAIEKAEPTE